MTRIDERPTPGRHRTGTVRAQTRDISTDTLEPGRRSGGLPAGSAGARAAGSSPSAQTIGGARSGRRAAGPTARVGGVRHLYVHLPFCAHRCGYCDFVTLVGRPDSHGAYVDALLAELELERRRARARARDRLPRWGHADLYAAGRARAAAASAAARGGCHRRGQPRDDHRRARVVASRQWRHARVAGGAELPAAPPADAGARRHARGRPARVRGAADRRLRQPLARPDLRDPRPERGRSGGRSRRRARARARAPVLLRAGGEAGDALHPRARRRARPPGRCDGSVLRACRHPPHRGGLPLVRDGEFLPRGGAARSALAAQPRVLARPRLPRARDRRRIHRPRHASPERSAPRAVRRRARPRGAAAARGRAAPGRGAAARTRHARAPARRAARPATLSSPRSTRPRSTVSSALESSRSLPTAGR